MNCTVDASVFVAAARTQEIFYADSRYFFEQARSLAASLFCPLLILPECAAAIARPTGDSMLAEEIVTLIQSFPGLRLVALDPSLTQRAVKVAVERRLRGADSIYVAVANSFNTTLITWDAEVIERASAVVPTMTPAQWTEEQQPAE